MPIQLPGPVQDAIAFLARTHQDWSPGQVHREILRAIQTKQPIAGVLLTEADAPSLRSVQRHVPVARAEGGPYTPWEMARTAPEDWPLVFEALRVLDEQQGKASMLDHAIVEWYVRIRRAFPDMGEGAPEEGVLYALRLATNMHRGNVRDVVDCLTYPIWRDGGKALDRAHRRGLVTDRAMEISARPLAILRASFVGGQRGREREWARVKARLEAHEPPLTEEQWEEARRTFLPTLEEWERSHGPEEADDER